MKNKISLSKLTTFFIFLVILITNFQLKKWNDPNGVINADVRAYYAYLPAIFIYNDLKFENFEHQKDLSNTLWTFDTGNGSRYIKLSSGMAILYSPFFLVAHKIAPFMGVEANGFTYPYKIALILSSIFYLCIALIFARKLLLRFFNEKVSSFALLILFLGTNLFHYYTGDPAMSHGYSLAFIFLFLFAVIKWLETPSLKWSFWIGLSAGFFTLIRPTDILYLLFLLLYGVHSYQDLKNRLVLFWKKRTLIFWMIFFAFLIFIPQFLYFKYIFNEWMHFTYTGESFFFLNPQLYNLSFSYRNGWLVYSPLMFFSILGFFYLKNNKTKWFVIVVFIIYYYILSSWWCWWYSGFGNRAMINLYPLLIIPLGETLNYLFNKKKSLRIISISILSLGILFSLFQSYQFRHWAIHYDAMTAKAYWDSFGRTEASQLLKLYLEEPVKESSLKGEKDVYVYKIDTLSKQLFDFEINSQMPKNYLKHLSSQTAFSKKNSLFIKGDEYTLNTKISLGNYNHIYISGWIKNNKNIHFSLKNDIDFYALSHDVQEKRKNWSKIQLLAEIPPSVATDSIELFVWNPERVDFYLDKLSILKLNISKIIKHD